MTIRSAMADVSASDYERIFGHSGPKCDYSGDGSVPQESVKDKPQIQLIDDDGKKIDKVTFHHKNKIYKQAKQMKEDLKHVLCTKDECRDPTDRNVQKMLKNELQNPHTRAYKMAMQAIGADPKDCEVERLRR